MKNRVWLMQIPIILFFTAAFWVTQQGVEGDLTNPFLREKVYPHLRRFSSVFLDLKFHVRGPEKPRNNIVIVEIDSPALEVVGRWPWDRAATAFLTEKIFDAGAKVVGYDITFSEPNVRVSEPLRDLLNQNKLGHLADSFETDRDLERVIALHRENLVLGWMSQGECQPGYSTPDDCPIDRPELAQLVPEGFDRFGFDAAKGLETVDLKKSPFLTVPHLIANIPLFSDLAIHQGYLNAQPDPDSVIRRANAFRVVKGSLQPMIAFAMARAGTGKKLVADIGSDQRVKSVRLGEGSEPLPATPLGALNVNFRGPGRTFTYVSATELLRDDNPNVSIEVNRAPASVPKKDFLKDAYVLIGLTAVGVFDMRAFPFDPNVAGVEGHATILDNLLSNDFLSYGPLGREASSWIMFFILIAGGLAFAFATEKLESIPALLLGAGVIASLGFIDMKLLFSNRVHWDFSFLYAQLGIIFIFTTGVKYVLEERNKKFIKGAFSKYVSPAIVDSILKDPTKLSVGGEKRELSILFSDIRSFTTMSEKMDPKALAGFLNDYLGIMTDVVFDTNGTLDKYIGDAVMAFWGAPLDQPDHAANSCRAARIMMQKLAEHRPRFKEQYGVDVNIGIGINSGAVNVGNMGSERIFEYTVIGDHVNLASRLEGLTKEYHAGILTTRFTMNDIVRTGKEVPPHRTLDFVKVKGKNEAVELIQIFESDPDAEGIRLFDEGRTLYTQRRWDEAIALFRQADEKLRGTHSQDGASQMYIERCEQFKANPPEQDWDGSWKMTTK